MRKKFLLIILSVLMCCLAACSDVQNSESSESSESVNSATSEVISENDDNIEFSEDKVLYYEGHYVRTFHISFSRVFDSDKLLELYSDSVGGITEYFNNNEVSDDTWFFVNIVPNGIPYNPENNTEHPQEYEEAKAYLKSLGFIEYENHPMTWNPEYKIELDACSTHEEEYEVRQRILETMLPDVDPGIIKKYVRNNNVYISELLECRFHNIGYINYDALKQIATANDTFGFSITWFPAPDNQELFLTFSYRLPSDKPI